MNWDNIKYLLDNYERIRPILSDSFQSQLEEARRIEAQLGPITAHIKESTVLSAIANEQKFFIGLNGAKKILADWEIFKRVSENQEHLRQIIREWEIIGNLKGIWDEKWVPLLSTAKKLKEKLEPFRMFLSGWSSIYSDIAQRLATDFSEHIFQWRKISEPFFESYRFNSIDFEGLKRFSHELEEIRLSINEDGSVTIDDQTIFSNEIAEDINNILKKEGRERPHLSKFIGKLLETASKSGKSRIKFIVGIIIYSILLPLITNLISYFINPVVEKEVKRLIEKNPKNITRTLKKHNFSDIIFLSDSRFVVVDRLNVRYKPCRKSNLIGKLVLGDVVKVLRIRKDWTLVHYEDQENSISIQGWVFSRYLKKFRNRYPQ